MTLCADWIVEADVRACEPCTTSLGDEVDISSAITAASEILYELSGRQWTGECERVLRPCRVRCGCSCHSARWGCDGCCPPTVDLGEDVIEVSEVMIDGTIVAESTYRLDGSRWLVRTRAGASVSSEGWPCTQDLTLPVSEPGTWQITFTQGQDPPEGGKLAAAAFACQWALACAASADCKLPNRVQSYIRQGVSVAMIDPLFFLDKGKTGITVVDMWLTAVNPYRLQSRARILSPEMLHRRSS